MTGQILPDVPKTNIRKQADERKRVPQSEDELIVAMKRMESDLQLRNQVLEERIEKLEAILSSAGLLASEGVLSTGDRLLAIETQLGDVLKRAETRQYATTKRHVIQALNEQSDHANDPTVPQE